MISSLVLRDCALSRGRKGKQITRKIKWHRNNGNFWFCPWLFRFFLWIIRISIFRLSQRIEGLFYSIPAILVFVRSAMLLILFESNPFLEIRHDSHYSSKKTRLKRVEDPITHPNTDYKEMVRYTQNKKEWIEEWSISLQQNRWIRIIKNRNKGKDIQEQNNEGLKKGLRKREKTRKCKTITEKKTRRTRHTIIHKMLRQQYKSWQRGIHSARRVQQHRYQECWRSQSRNSQ